MGYDTPGYVSPREMIELLLCLAAGDRRVLLKQFTVIRSHNDLFLVYTLSHKVPYKCHYGWTDIALKPK